MRRGRILLGAVLGFRTAHILAKLGLVVAVTGAAAVACSSSSSGNGSGNDAGAADDSSPGGGSSSGGIVNPFGDSGMGMATFNCHGPADCTEGGAGQACCFDIMSMTASCAPAPCAMYTQCATSADCPGGGMCTPSPLSMTEHYCVGGGSFEGGIREGGGAEAGSEAGSSEASTEAAASEAGTNDGATE